MNAQDIKNLMYGLTVMDRPTKRAFWLAKGFNRMGPERLLSYWENRLAENNPEDTSMFLKALEDYRVANKRRKLVDARVRENEIRKNNVLQEIKAKRSQNSSYPGAATIVKSAVIAAAKWANNGFKSASETAIMSRTKICESCEFWSPGALRQTGRCRRCGCATWAKIRMASESCPEQKWVAEV